MPTYDYACKGCGHRFELLQTFSEAPAKKCPKCGKPKAERQFSGGGGFIFKGSGFYETDYKKGSEPKADTTPSASVESPAPKEAPAKPSEKDKSAPKAKKPKKTAD